MQGVAFGLQGTGVCSPVDFTAGEVYPLFGDVAFQANFPYPLAAEIVAVPGGVGIIGVAALGWIQAGFDQPVFRIPKHLGEVGHGD